MSVNSFGFGGSNSHIILDDALHCLQERGLVGNHCTVSSPRATNGHTSNGNSHDTIDDEFLDEPVEGSDGGSSLTRITSSPKLLVWSAADEKGVRRTVQGYETFYRDVVSGDSLRLSRLAYTLASRRSHMLWRTFSVVLDGEQDKEKTALSPTRPVRSSTDPGLAFVFTGQGAQYVGMGLSLIQYPVFARTLREIDDVYRSLGCEWSLFGR